MEYGRKQRKLILPKLIQQMMRISVEFSVDVALATSIFIILSLSSFVLGPLVSFLS
jgi:hypothetical protein